MWEDIFKNLYFRCQQSGFVWEGWGQEGWSCWYSSVHESGQNWNLNVKINLVQKGGEFWLSVANFWHLNQCIYYCKVYCVTFICNHAMTNITTVVDLRRHRNSDFGCDQWLSSSISSFFHVILHLSLLLNKRQCSICIKLSWYQIYFSNKTI